MDVHPAKNGINRYWSIPIYLTNKNTRLEPTPTWQKSRRCPRPVLQQPRTWLEVSPGGRKAMKGSKWFTQGITKNGFDMGDFRDLAAKKGWILTNFLMIEPLEMEFWGYQRTIGSFSLPSSISHVGEDSEVNHQNAELLSLSLYTYIALKNKWFDQWTTGMGLSSEEGIPPKGGSFTCFFSRQTRMA